MFKLENIEDDDYDELGLDFILVIVKIDVLEEDEDELGLDFILVVVVIDVKDLEIGVVVYLIIFKLYVSLY